LPQGVYKPEINNSEKAMASASSELIGIKTDGVRMEGMLELPPDPIGIILFAHGSGSSRLSPRNNYIAGELRKARLGTLLLDLLSKQEDQTYQTRFDIGLLTQRLGAAANWLRRQQRCAGLPLGLFGASTGAAAALQLAALRGPEIGALVSRGGRADLAGRQALKQVIVPTLLIVGGLDFGVIELNRAACASLRCEKRLDFVPGASHLFEEPGTLEMAARLATAWFVRHLSP
jgi:putative phosphoribosyl transferase